MSAGGGVQTTSRIRPTIPATTAALRANGTAVAPAAAVPTLSTQGWNINGWEYVVVTVLNNGNNGQTIVWRIWLYDPNAELWFPDAGGVQTNTKSAADGSTTSRPLQVKGASRVFVEIQGGTAASATYWIDITE